MALRQIALGASLWCLLAAGVWAAEDPPRQEVASRNESFEDDPALQEIAELRIAPPGPSGSSVSLSEVVNLFPARKRRRFHGSVYEFHRNDNLDARNFFDPVGQPLPEFKRNQFGFNLGTSFFSEDLTLLGSYDGLRIIRGSTLISRVPTVLEKAGDFSASGVTVIDPITGQPFPGNRIPRQRFDPSAVALMQVLPDPNLSDPDRNYVNNLPNITNQDSFSIRADYRFDDESKIFGNYSFSDNNGNEVEELRPFETLERRREQEASVDYSQTVSPRLSFRGGVFFRRTVRSELSVNAGRVGLHDSFGIQGVSVRGPEDEGFPDVELPGYVDFGDGGSPDASANTRFGGEVAATYVAGRHNLQFGGSYTVIQPLNNRTGDGIRGEFEFSGGFTGDAFADFLLGLPIQAERARGSERIDLETYRWSAYVNDRWRINDLFDLTLGLRYDFFRPYQSRADNISTFLPLEFEPPLNGQVVLAGSPQALAFGLEDAGERGLVLPDRNDFSPQIAIAYSPWGNQQFVLRANYSIDHDPPREFVFIRNLGRNFPFFFSQLARSDSETPQLQLSDPFQNVTQRQLTFHGIEPNARTPYIQEWGLRLQAEPIQRWVVEAGYEGSRGLGWWRSLPSNVPLPGEGDIQPRRPNPEFGLFNIEVSGGSWSYHALEVEVERRLSDGFSLTADYTWQNSMNDLTDNPANPRNLDAERALNGPRHVFEINYLWDLPLGRNAGGLWGALVKGWRISGITRLRSGGPFSVTVSGDPNNDGLSGDRPDLVGSTRSGFTPNVDEWFDTSIFAPAAGPFGTAGRNILYGPGRQVWDLAFSKRARISDSDVLELRVQLFNAFNHVNFGLPDSDLSSSVFGKIFSADEAREIEIAIKYSF
ncbi:MAG TPA: TonB-dependent receptor [Acidobacteriota bacterium]|nr:TonB-dependent receptor [Acidobacteriota bacterium]